MSLLKPEVSLGVALATGAVVYGIYQRATPTHADIRSLQANNADINAAERQATWTAAGVVGAISLIAHDPTVFTVGGLMIIAEAWKHRHANMVDSTLGRPVPTNVTPATATPPQTQAEAPSMYSAPASSGYDTASVI